MSITPFARGELTSHCRCGCSGYRLCSFMHMDQSRTWRHAYRLARPSMAHVLEGPWGDRLILQALVHGKFVHGQFVSGRDAAALTEWAISSAPGSMASMFRPRTRPSAVRLGGGSSGRISRSWRGASCSLRRAARLLPIAVKAAIPACGHTALAKPRPGMGSRQYHWFARLKEQNRGRARYMMRRYILLRPSMFIAAAYTHHAADRRKTPLCAGCPAAALAAADHAPRASGPS